ncbi:MAG: adenylate/guanylate cyclase domain-containing protein [Myxococcales bacterium]|nr:adenylate/guanylate cyclase domain-containing protein [Myxococcales bacterium]
MRGREGSLYTDGPLRALVFHRLTARFVDPALERAFEAEYVPDVLAPFVRRTLGFGALTYSFYGLHDLLVLPQPASAWSVRYALVVPCLLLCWASTFTALFRRGYQWIGLAYGLAATGGVLLIASKSPAEPSILYAGFASLFVTIGPLIARLDVARQALYTLISSILLVVFEWRFSRTPRSVNLAVLWTVVGMGSLGTVISWLNERQQREAFLARKTIREQSDEIARERARSDELLRNVLPDAVAARLKNGETSIADGYDEATVLFADIVGFTPLSAKLSPEALVARLNEVFTAFDARCSELGLEKIKTIGDAYMVVGGLPEKREGHAIAVVNMALAMREVLADQRARHGDDLDVRIGVHTGPVVAGVIGTRKFAYDVWGDTVNTASRMESHALPGHIQVSDRTRVLVEHAFDLEDRGEITVKGKGAMRTWFVHRKRAS